jgi:5-methylcytosine-specific restriction endonuclease McrA
MEAQTCTKCGEEHPLTEEFFRMRKDRGAFYTQCRGCERAYTNKWREKNPEKAKTQMQKFKEQNPVYWKEHQKNNPEMYRNAQSKHYHSGKGKEYLLKWAKENPEKIKIAQKKWEENNPEKLRFKWALRRERERNYDSTYTFEESEDTCKLFEYKCANCGMDDKEHYEKFEQLLPIDHFKPLSKGYGLSPTNAILLCRNCNSRKSDKTPADFFSKEKLMEIKERLGLE